MKTKFQGARRHGLRPTEAHGYARRVHHRRAEDMERVRHAVELREDKCLVGQHHGSDRQISACLSVPRRPLNGYAPCTAPAPHESEAMCI